MVDIPKMIPAKLFLNWPDRIEGDQIYIVRTTIEHLSQYVSWRKWEGKLSLENEEENVDEEVELDESDDEDEDESEEDE